MARKAGQTVAATGGGNAANGEADSRRGFEIGMHVADDNPWQLESCDQPGIVLISTVLTGNNYSVWSRLMTVALGAKGKLGFVNGEIEALDENSPNYSKWKRADCMVFCWITNSLSKEIMEAFIYAESAKELWDNLEQAYGLRSGLMLYMIHRQIFSARQGSNSVTEYFTTLMKLCGELGCAIPKKCECDCECECDAKKVAAERKMDEKVMQFLGGLDESFDQVRELILRMDPLPNIYEAYSKVLAMEKFLSKRDENAAAEGGKARPRNAVANFTK